jgi:hypothetical protein
MASRESDIRAMELIKSSGALNPNMTMDKLLDLTQKLADLEPTVDAAAPAANAKHVDTFIHRHFIFRHEE